MKIRSQILLLVVLLLAINLFGQSESTITTTNLTYTNNLLHETIRVKPVKGKQVKNVILMIADGMGLTHFSTAWVTNNGKMNIDNCSYTGLVKTYCADKLITDSGAAGTAMATGQKANYHSISVDLQNKPLASLTDLANEKGLSTGIVVTCGLTDATPAVFCANNPDRDMLEEIAIDFLNCDVDFLFGGGREKFNKRNDNRNLIEEMKEKKYQVCYSWEEMSKVNEGKVFAVLEDGQLPLANERGDLFQKATGKAIEILSNNRKGFFAMIEGSRIDDCGHWNDLPKLIDEINDFDKTVGQVLQWAENDGKTLVIILADHETGALTLTGGNISTNEVSVNFANKAHSGIMVPVYSYGPQSNQFTGIMDNTDIFKKIKSILKL